MAVGGSLARRFAAGNSPCPTMSETAPTPPSSGNPRRMMFIVAFMAAVACSFLFGDPQSWLNSAIVAVEKLGPWGPVVFALLYILAAVLMVPGFALTLSAGTLFGVFHGTIIVSLASTTAAAVAFLIARYLARDAIAAKTRTVPAFATLDRAFGDDGWKLVGLIRLSPLFPFSLLNYAFGLTRVKFLHYVVASWAAMLPATLVYVYLGSLARAGARGGEKSPLEWTIYGVGLLATLAVTVFITKAAKKAMREQGLPVEKPVAPAAAAADSAQ